MTSERKALYLLADSQLLFWNVENSRLISSVRESLQINQTTITKAAYIGASNGDNPEFFDLFVAAMSNIDIHESRMITSAFLQDEQNFLESADLILLAGGDFDLGWETIKNTGMAEIISKKYYSGAVIIGISAGAMQLGMGGGNSSSSITQTLQLFPYYVSVHEEECNWSQLKQLIEEGGQYDKGFGISAGGGMIYHPDSTIEPIRNTINEILKPDSSEKDVSTQILLPPSLE